MQKRTFVGAAVASTVMLLMTPTAGNARSSVAVPAAGAVAAPVWQVCPPPEDSTPRDPRQQCATIRVPLDYRNPHGRQIALEISRIATANPALRRGILLFNPGGPGGTALDLPSLEATLLPPAVLDRYDLIGFDPRGIGYSTPVSCGTDPNTAPDLYSLPFPAPDGSIARNVAFARTVAAGCATHSGDLLPYITTANTARDMDRIRAALGEPRLSYLGYSYGTYLGTVYTSLFPQHSDRIILDSAVNANLVWYQQWRLFSLGFALRFPDFTGWAAEQDATYHLGATPDAVAHTYDSVAARLDRDPIVEPNGLVVNGNVFRLVTFELLYGDANFPTLAGIWQQLTPPAEASAGALAAIRATLASPSAASTAIPADNGKAAQWAILCDDVAWPRDTATYARNVTADRRAFPRTAGFPPNIWPCAFWPDRPIEAAVRADRNGPHDVLILQNLRDPATPWIGALGLRQEFGKRATMVNVDQGGHGVYPLTNAPCAAAIATAFLVDGTLPAHDQYCPGEPPGALNAQPRVTTLPGSLG